MILLSTRRLSGVGVLVATALAMGGCDDVTAVPTLSGACKLFGVCDELPPPAEMVDILCDASIGSSCTRESLGRAMDDVLHRAAQSPGSRTRLWSLAKTVADTNAVAEKETPSESRKSSRARKGLGDKFVAASKEYFTAAIAPTFALAPIRRSPLAEAMTKIALADSGQLPRRLIVITDAREVSNLGDFECGFLPTDAGFVKKLQRRRILGPSTLKGVQVFSGQLRLIHSRVSS